MKYWEQKHETLGIKTGDIGNKNMRHWEQNGRRWEQNYERLGTKT